MVWEYLGQFWDKIAGVVASTTADVVSYPVEFFQNIGNAVAGAVGSIFDTFFHTFADITYFFAWSFEMTGIIFNKLSLPFSFIYHFVLNIFSYGFATPNSAELTYSFSTSTLSVFNAIPHWGTLSMILGIGLIIFVGVGTFKLLLRI